MSTNPQIESGVMPRRKVQVHVYVLPAAGGGEPLFLALQRPPSRGAIWQPVTGNADGDEPLDECARREVREETGIARLRDLCRLHEFAFEKKGLVYLETVFVARAEDDVVLLSGEHDAYRWLPAARARAMYHFDSNRAGLDAAVAHVMGVGQ